tara:strand:+ start:17153 stop:17602 length:450 start_codon:yes stop_codon:yes gene_type:complete
MKNTLIVKKLEANNCEIMLDKAESLFLSEEVINLSNNNMLDVKNLNKVLKEFQENNSVNYYSNSDINKISKNLLSSFKKKLTKEELGRNLSTQKGVLSTVNDSGTISPDKLALSHGFDNSVFFNEEDHDEEENFVTIRNILTKIIVNSK